MKRILVFLVLAACDTPDVVNNWSFDQWKNGQLVDWSTDRGSVAPAPTWNQYDTGITFPGGDAQISQVIDADSTQAVYSIACYAFDIEAEVDPGTEMIFAIDVGNRGTETRSFAIPSAGWAPLHYSVGIALAPWRLILRKSGDGEAVVAQIRALPSDTCPPDEWVYPCGTPQSNIACQ